MGRRILLASIVDHQLSLRWALGYPCFAPEPTTSVPTGGVKRVDNNPTTRSDSEPARRPLHLYVVATVHLDTQWRWTVQDTIRDFLPATLEGNFAHFERHPFFVLSFEGAFRYMLIKEYYPEEFERLRGYVEQGRWAVAGSMLDSPDVNVVSPESLIRHILYGNRFFEQELGRRSCDLFLPDCFGFSWALPSIAVHCGLDGFSSQKFGNWMAPAEIPFEIGVWRGPDGAEVVAALRPEGYGEGLSEDLSRAPRWVAWIERTGGGSGPAVGLKYVGIGDRGGALDEASMTWLARSIEGEGPIQVTNTASDQLFRDLDETQTRQLPRHASELLLPKHGTGCLTSQAVLKKWNRRNELMADAAERAAVVADWLGSLPYPADRLQQGWTRFLWHQMHDDLTGTSIPPAYGFSWNDELVALNLFTSALTESVGAVAESLDTRAEGIPLVVFNPLSRERQDLVEARLRFAAEPPTAVRVLAPDGNQVPAQIVRRGDRELDVLFLAAVPSFGFQVYDVQAADRAAATDHQLGISESHLENHRYRVEIDDRGDICNLYDKELETELLAAPQRLQLLPDRSPRWPAWEIRYEDVTSPEPPAVSGPVRRRILEEGPARVCLEIERRTRGSTFVQRLRLADGAAGHRLEVETRVDWQTRGRLLKAVFPLTVSSRQATYDLGLGAIERGNNRRDKYEVPAQQWADLTSEAGYFGVSILSDGKLGWDKPDDSTLRLSLLRSPRTWRKFLHQATQDHGSHRFGYALYGHRGSWREGDTPWQAARFNQPLLAFRTTAHPGKLGKSFSFLRLDHPQVLVRAFKQAEEGSDLIVRLQETQESPAEEVVVGLAPPIAEAREVDGSERPLRAAAIEDGKLLTELGSFAPRTFALRPEAGPSVSEPAAGQPLPLPFDVVATSFHGNGKRGDFDGRGRTYPGEQFPSAVSFGGVELRLGPSHPGSANALACRGQALDLPAGDFNRLHLLAAAVEGDAGGTFDVDGQPIDLRIQSYSGTIGRWKDWRRRPWGWSWSRSPSGFLKRDPIAWLTTHRHDQDGRDEPYVFCYLFHYSIELEAGARFVLLPEVPEIRLFAVTAARERIGDTKAAFDPYD
ncbi:MAG: alpha-mannosidase [Acidobacteria bacterium]|nr:MAG: alpha-mannosidase [Acidobacteriota bacterium]